MSISSAFFRATARFACLALLVGHIATAAPSARAPDLDALQLVKQFVAEELHGDLNALLTYDLAILESHPAYGAPDRTFDTDDCNLVRAIFALLYTDALPGLTYATVGTGRPFRGDTLNSFNSLFGKPLPENPDRFAGLERRHPSDALRARAAAFHHTYHTLGNFAPLPNRSLNRKTFNTYRGTRAGWYDAFPIFLQNLHLALLDDPSADEMLAQLVENNADAFAPFRTPDGLLRFAGALDLNDYIDSGTALPIPHYAPHAHYASTDPAAYLASVDHYLTIVPVLIQRRTTRMIARLREILAQNP